MMSTVSVSYAWPGRAATVRFYVYDATGKLLSREETRKVGAEEKMELRVPESGMVIAEVVEG